MSIKSFIKNALNAADLMQGYVDLVCEKIEEYEDDLVALRAEVTKIKVDGPETAAAKAVLLWVINDMIENPDKG